MNRRILSFPFHLRRPRNCWLSGVVESIRNKLQHIAVDAIAFIAWRRAVVEDVAEVDAGAGAADFDALHAVREIVVQRYRSFDGIEKAGPAGAAVELCLTEEKRGAGDRVDKPSGAFLIQVGCGERRLGALRKGDSLLLRRQ